MIHDFRPDLLPKVRELSMQARQNVLSMTLTGNWLSRLKGRGIEFEGYRKYLPVDDASMIDWKASLRAKKLLIKELTEDKNLSVFVAFDVSDTMIYGSGDKLKVEYATGIIATISLVALHAGDSVGLVTFTDKVEKLIMPQTGTKQHHIITSVLRDPANYGGASHIGKPLLQMLSYGRQKGLLIIISDFLSLPDNWQRYLRIANQKFDMIGIILRDKRDRTLPKNAGEYALKDPQTGEKIIIDCADYAQKYKDYVEQEEKKIISTFRSLGGEAVVIETTQNMVKSLIALFAQKSHIKR